MRILSTNQDQKEDLINENFLALNQASLFGWRIQASSSLVFAYYGGNYQDSFGDLTNISDGTVTLTASVYNYIYFNPSTNDVEVSLSTPTSGMVRIARLLTDTTKIIQYRDERLFVLFPVGTGNGLSSGGGGGANIGSNIARMNDLTASPGGWSNYTFKSRIYGSKIVNNASTIKIRFIAYTSETTFLIDKIVVKRTLRNSTTVLDSTNASVGGVFIGISIISAGSGIDTIVLTDDININIDQYHDYYFYVHFANDSLNNNLHIYTVSGADGDCFGTAASSDITGETTISGGIGSNASLFDSIIVTG